MTLGNVSRKENILMIFAPIWPKNDIRLEEHDFSNFLFFPDRLMSSEMVIKIEFLSAIQ